MVSAAARHSRKVSYCVCPRETNLLYSCIIITKFKCWNKSYNVYVYTAQSADRNH